MAYEDVKTNGMKEDYLRTEGSFLALPRFYAMRYRPFPYIFLLFSCFGEHNEQCAHSEHS